MCSNSCFATHSRSGAKRRGFAYTGAPVVFILCEPMCLIGVSQLFVFFNDGNSLRMFSYRLDGTSFSTVGLVDSATFDMKPFTSILVFASTRCVRKEHIEDKTTSLLVQIYNRIRILVMLQIMRLNISYQLYVITKISAIISRYLTAKFEQ